MLRHLRPGYAALAFLFTVTTVIVMAAYEASVPVFYAGMFLAISAMVLARDDRGRP